MDERCIIKENGIKFIICEYYRYVEFPNFTIMRMMAERTAIDWCGKYKDKEIVGVDLDDAVRFSCGGYVNTGIVKYIGFVDYVEPVVIGILTDQWHPLFSDGCINGEKYFTVDMNGRGYFAHAEQIRENLGTTIEEKLGLSTVHSLILDYISNRWKSSNELSKVKR